MLPGFLRHLNRSNIANISKLNISTSVLFKNKLPNDDSKVSANNAVLDRTKLKLFELMSIYEEAIGIKEIKNAQQSVLEVIEWKKISKSQIKIIYSLILERQKKTL